MYTDDFTIISVESRKGGVGKTTIALNLASLLKKNYHVLILDVDVTGTSINAVQDTSVWEKNVRLIKNSKGETINLLQFFKDQYLSGNFDMRFSLEPQKKGAICVYSDYINVISSELYGPDGSLLYDPSIIFDEIHDFWLVDMILRIAKSFSYIFDDKKSIIILDNSPGYVGMGKSIHDMLTDIGPVRGKFLSVSSLDCQDMDSCLKAIHNIHSIICEKVDGASFFQDKNADLSKLDGVALATFDRLAIGDESLQYYNSDSLSKPELDSYQAIVFNKVPVDVINGMYAYRYVSMSNNTLADTFMGLCGSDPRPCMIPYDQSIHYQFFRRNIVKADLEPLDERMYMAMKRVITRLEKLALKETDDPDFFTEPSRISLIANRMTTLSKVLSTFTQTKFTHHISEDWNPKYIFMEMYRCLQRMGLIPPFRSYRFIGIKKIKLETVELHPWDNCFTDIRLLNAQRTTLAFLEGILSEYDFDRCFLLGPISMAIHSLLGMGNNNTITRDNLLSFVNRYRNSTSSEEELFQLLFVESMLRVLDLPDDILFICEALSRFFNDDSDSPFSTADDIIWIVNKKVITKEFSSEEASSYLNKSILESNYMDVVCKSLMPIINKWSL